MSRPAPDTIPSKQVYLAGAIEYAPDGGKVWRREMETFLRNELHLSVFNPCINEVALLSPEENSNFRDWKQSDRERFLPVIRRIIDHDLANVVNHTEFIVCYWDEYVSMGAGTAGELTAAYMHGVPVYLVLGIPRVRLSSWAAGCATHIFEDFDELKRFLLGRHLSEPALTS